MNGVAQGLERAVALATLLALPAAAWSTTNVPERGYVLRSEAAGTPVHRGVLRFTGRRIVIPVVAVEPGKPDTTFEVHGEVDPTLVVPVGARLRFELANADAGMPHGLDVTARIPPYPQMLHLSTLKRTHGEVAVHDPGTLMQAVAITGLVRPATGSGAHIEVRSTDWFSLRRGAYYYVCHVPGHASRGMYGKIVVR